MTRVVSNPAIVLGLDPNALGTLRALAGYTRELIAVEKRPSRAAARHWGRWMSSHTRLCQKVFYDGHGASSGLVDSLVELGARLDAKGVLFPSADEQVFQLSEQRERLTPYFEFSLPSPDTIETLYDKSRLYEFAVKQGLEIPETFWPSASNPIEHIARTIRYPCLIKPHRRDLSWGRRFGAHKVLFATTADELVRGFERVSAVHDQILVQEFVPGPDSQLRFSHVYLARTGEPLAVWTGRKLRQWPIRFGNACLAETVWDASVADLSIRLLSALGVHGYASVEFKKDPRDGSYKLMDIAAWRTCYHHFLGVAAGVNLPRIWYDDMMGNPVAYPGACVQGLKWIDEYCDLRAAYAYWKAGELTLPAWVRSYRGRKVFTHASVKDPLPAVFVLLRVTLDAGRAAFRRRRPISKAYEADPADLGAKSRTLADSS